MDLLEEWTHANPSAEAPHQVSEGVSGCFCSKRRTRVNPLLPSMTPAVKTQTLLFQKECQKSSAIRREVEYLERINTELFFVFF